MNRNPESLRAAGEALFGPHWQTPLSVSLGVADRTVRRWAAGEFAIPAAVWAEIGELCRRRGRALDKLAEKLL